MNPLVIKLLVVAGIFGAGCYLGYEYASGQEAKQVVKTITKTEVKEKIIREAAASAEVQYVTKYVHIRDKQDEIIKEIPKYIPAGYDTLPASFGVLYNSSIESAEVPASSSVDDSPIETKAFFTTITENNGTCQADQLKLEQLQNNIRDYQKVTND